MVDQPRVAGCDEAGRGPLAGPVVCAAVVLPERHDILGLADSKALSPESRESLFEIVLERAEHCVVSVSAAEIDLSNILRASLQGMARAVAGLPSVPSMAVVDGNQVPPGMPCPCEAWVKGDAKHAAVAAASILAKVTRDRIMRELARDYPAYGFERNFGYPTPDHLVALRLHGPCPVHRASFGPVRDVLNQPTLFHS